MTFCIAWVIGCGGFAKASPKKLPETDAIFAHLKQVHAQAAADPHTLRISLDTKAKVKLGGFSRGGTARGVRAVAAADHDMHPDAVLTPAGILEVDSGQLNLIFGNSRETSDFVADCLELWWTARRAVYPHTKRLLINLDNGPEIRSARTQFMKRLVEFAERHQLEVELAYYPPYHSKYNRIERCWGVLEKHWNGALLKTIETTLEWARTMTWRGIRPFVQLLDRVYATGAGLPRSLFRPIAARLERSQALPAWSLTIKPHPG
jgi:transposase